jgi:AmmeMemoRadiSam system protein A
MIAPPDRKRLLMLARAAVVSHVTGAPPAAAECDGVLALRAGAFVSIHRHRELRGCIGRIEADEMLGYLVPRCAIAAASEDPRFLAIVPPELPDLEIELSILGTLEEMRIVTEFEIGRHGLVADLGTRRGLLLPQVAVEWGWDRSMFLAQTCRKAGLAPDAWRHGAKIWRFEAEVFGDATAAALPSGPGG